MVFAITLSVIPVLQSSISYLAFFHFFKFSFGKFCYIGDYNICIGTCKYFLATSFKFSLEMSLAD